MDLGACLSDFQVEMQNILVGGLFESRIAYRSPIDPTSKVIRLDRSVELKRYFENETKWGRHLKQVDEELRSVHRFR